MLLLIDNFDSFTWNLVHYLGELGAACEVVRNDSLTPAEALARCEDAGAALAAGLTMGIF